MRLLITAGPTREPIDAVRFVGNRSSGRLGVALAEAAVAVGHTVTLLLGRGATTPPPADRTGLQVVGFDSTADLQAKLAEYFPAVDTLVMAAAVADYRPASVQSGKLPSNASGRLVLELEPTPDLVGAVTAGKQPQQHVIAFALEDPADLPHRARVKRDRKGVDAIVANPLGTMEAETITAWWLPVEGEEKRFSALSKTAFAAELIQRIEALTRA